MRQSNWAVLATVVLSGACGGGEAGPRGTAAWSLDPGVTDNGEGVPFCEAAMARVASHMGQFEGQVPPDDTYGGTAVVGAIGELTDGMNGHVSALYESTQHQNFVNQMTLVQYDEDLNPVPYLAESWEVSDDFTELIFHLRNDVYWHDGELTDAYDVAYTFERSTDPETAFANPPFWTHYDQGPGGMEVVDSFTVKFRMQPHSDFIDPWRTVSIMPQHLLEDVPSAEIGRHPYGSVCPVGNGPFVFVQHRQEASWTFQANPGFPAGLGGRPHLDRLVYRSVSEQTTLLTELLTETVDIQIAPRPSQAQAILDSDALDLRRFPQRQYVFVGWNARRPQLADKRVRLAITKGTNRQQVVDALLEGYGKVANGSVPPWHWAYDGSIGAEANAYDPEAARALLDEAGWIDRDGDGVRENAEGVRLSITIKSNTGNQQRADIAEIMQAQLADIGVEITPAVLDMTTLIAQLTDPASRDYDAVVLGWVIDFKLDDTGIFHSDMLDAPLAFSGTMRSDMDAYMDRLPLILDRAEAKEVWREYQELLVDEQPYTFFFFPDRLDGVNRRLQGVEMDARGEWISVKDWWIPADQRRAGR